jgi:cold shock CspA family protein
MLNGTIVTVRPSFAFVESENPKMRAFVQMSDVEEAEKDNFITSFPVSFEVAFNMKGPVAQNLRSLLS